MSKAKPGRQRRTRAEQQAATRAALLDAGLRVFLERGFDGASVEAIATEAGFTRGAFYSNFESKEELFTELVRERGYRKYAQLATESFDPDRRPNARELGEQLAAIQEHPDLDWLFPLWLEMLAHAGRDETMRELAASFWAGTRAATAALIRQEHEKTGHRPTIAPEHLATALIALDIGLAVQHHVDPEAAPLDLYPKLYELLCQRVSQGA